MNEENKMKSLIVLGFLPLALACSHKGTDPTAKVSTSPNPPTNSLLALAPGVGWQSITGVTHYDSKCTVGKEASPCLTIKGGDDLNDEKTFYVNPSIKELQGIKENQHVQIVAQLSPELSHGGQEIQQVESVSLVYK